MAQVIAHPDLQALAPVARLVGGPALRNMASVGGNLFAPPPYGDLACALVAAGAEVVWADGRAEPVEDVLRGHARGIVAAVRVPRLAPGDLRFRKMTRTRPKGVAVMSLAAHLPMRGGAPGRGAARLVQHGAAAAARAGGRGGACAARR